MNIFKSLLLAAVLAFTATGCASTSADTRIGVGIHLDLFPDLHPVPGYPVYYAPNVSANLFFYDGAYWLYDRDGWYVSDWYNGPWEYVEPDYVPWFVLRIPVRYYRAPPPYFWGWYHDAPPRWGHYWGPRWSHRHPGWDRWDHSYVPRRAPLPTYQRDYRGNYYPDYRRQRDLHNEHYRYRPQDPHYNKYRDEHRGNDRPVYETPQRHVKPRGPDGVQFESGREGAIDRTGMDRNSGRYGERPSSYESRGFSQPQRPQPYDRQQFGREQPSSREQFGRERGPRQDRGGLQQPSSPPPQERQYQQPQQQPEQQPQQEQRQYRQPQRQVESRGDGRQQMRRSEEGGGRSQERNWMGRER